MVCLCGRESSPCFNVGVPWSYTINEEAVPMKKIISTTNAPAAIGPYSQAIDCGNFLVTSGQIPFDPATGEFVPGGITEQTRQVLTNIHERRVCRVLYRGTVSRPLRCGGRRPAQGCAGGDRNHLRKVNRYRKREAPAGRFPFCICTAFLNISQIFLSIFADNPWKMLDFRYFMCYTVCII